MNNYRGSKKIIINRLFKQNNPEEEKKKTKYFHSEQERSKGEMDEKLIHSDQGRKIFEENFFRNFEGKVCVKYESVERGENSKLPLKRNLFLQLKELQSMDENQLKNSSLLENTYAQLKKYPSYKKLNINNSIFQKQYEKSSKKHKYEDKEQLTTKPTSSENTMNKQNIMNTQNNSNQNKKQSTQKKYYIKKTCSQNRKEPSKLTLNQNDSYGRRIYHQVNTSKEHNGYSLDNISIPTQLEVKKQKNQHSSQNIETDRRKIGFIRHNTNCQSTKNIARAKQLQRKKESSEERLKNIRNQLNHIYNLRNQVQNRGNYYIGKMKENKNYYAGHPTNLKGEKSTRLILNIKTE